MRPEPWQFLPKEVFIKIWLCYKKIQEKTTNVQTWYLCQNINHNMFIVQSVSCLINMYQIYIVFKIFVVIHQIITTNCFYNYFYYSTEIQSSIFTGWLPATFDSHKERHWMRVIHCRWLPSVGLIMLLLLLPSLFLDTSHSLYLHVKLKLNHFSFRFCCRKH